MKTNTKQATMLLANNPRKVLWVCIGWFAIWMSIAQARFPYLTNFSRLGTTRHTVVFYVLAMLGGICFVVIAARMFRTSMPKIAKLLRTSGLAICMAMISPFTLSWETNLIHSVATTVFACLAVAITVLLAKDGKRSGFYFLALAQLFCMLGEVICIILAAKTPSWAWGFFEAVFCLAFATVIMWYSYSNLDK